MNVSDSPTLYTGIAGNKYVVCLVASALYPVCDYIGKSRESIYFNSRYGCFAIRLKNKTHKVKAIEFFKGD